MLEKSALSRMLADTRQELYEKPPEIIVSPIEKEQYRKIMQLSFSGINSKYYRIGNRIMETLKNPLKIFLWPYWVFKWHFSPLTNIQQYFELLNKLKREYIIIIAVKDTPGLAFNESVAQAMGRLGFKISLQNKHWHSYIGVVNAGKVAYEEISVNEEEVSYKSTLEGFVVKIVSKSLNSGNLAVIQIDGIDYAVNERGLNIVLIRKNIRQVVDSVCFDTHMPEFECIR
jgi:hypothetical protein